MKQRIRIYFRERDCYTPLIDHDKRHDVSILCLVVNPRFQKGAPGLRVILIPVKDIA
jgi:hypothetical protein